MPKSRATTFNGRAPSRGVVPERDISFAACPPATPPPATPPPGTPPPLTTGATISGSSRSLQSRAWLGITSRTDRAHESGRRRGLGRQTCVVEVHGREHAFHRAESAQLAHQGPGVDARDAHDSMPGEIVFERAFRAEIARHPAEISHDEAGQMGMLAFEIGGVDAIVADLGIGHRHDLAPIARIGQDFLIAGHRGVETHFAIDFAGGAEARARHDRAVFER